jgi:adenosylhomocysteinase
MDGFEVMPINDASQQGDIFITVTGDINVIDRSHFEVMKDGALVANSGHFNVELNLQGLAEMSKSTSKARDYVQEYKLHDGRRIFVLAEGRLVNLSVAEGHPSSVMDMSFANQALCAEYLAKLEDKLDPEVYPVPENIDLLVGSLKLNSMGVKIDTLTEEQETYLQSWTIGT